MKMSLRAVGLLVGYVCTGMSVLCVFGGFARTRPEQCADALSFAWIGLGYFALTPFFGWIDTQERKAREAKHAA
jgi:hypothetical protein